MKKTSTIFLIACVVLAAALLLSVIGLVSAKSEAQAAAEQIQALAERVLELEAHNQTLQAQLDAVNATQQPTQSENTPVDTEDYYCTLMVDDWSVKNGTLTVNVFAQAVLSENVKSTAQLELWNADAVLQTVPVVLDIGEAAGIYEADIVDAAFEIPKISADDELQLWLMVQPEGSDAIFVCGAGWYLEDGQLMLITG